ncbi:MAG: hypothetical protein ACU0DI_04555, partial [Paracoccaceae bacterium]
MLQMSAWAVFRTSSAWDLNVRFARFSVIRLSFFAAACTKVRFWRCITAKCHHAESLRWAANTKCATSREGPQSPQCSHSSIDIHHFLANGRFGEFVRVFLHMQRMAAIRRPCRITASQQSTQRAYSVEKLRNQKIEFFR